MPRRPDIVFFDMDHTLIDNDCDVSWKQFLIAEGFADPREMDDVHRFFDLYRQGKLPIDEFLRFQLGQFAGKSPDDMRRLAAMHFDKWVRHKIFPQARSEVDWARANGVPTAILTATNRIIAEPLAEELGIPYLVATELEIREGLFTGKIEDPYCYNNHKITKARDCCAKVGARIERARYFGDSVADIPMLKRVAEAIAVNPGAELRRVAECNGWRVVHWSL